MSASGARGFSLVEFMVSTVLLLVLMASVFTILSKYQKQYQGQQLGAEVLSDVNSTMELLSQEIGQAGSFGFASRNLSGAVVSGAAAQWVAISSVADIFVGERLLVDAGASEELVTVTGVNATSIQGIFQNSHPLVSGTGAVVNAMGAFTEGVLTSSTATTLQLYGDVNGDGTLVYVEYNCDLGTGTLTRTITPITAGVQSTKRVMLQGLQANPNTTACFLYRTKTVGTITSTVEVWVTLTSRAAAPDPETKTYRSNTSSLIVSLRNVLAGLDLAQNMPNRVQSRPTGLPLSPGS